MLKKVVVAIILLVMAWCTILIVAPQVTDKCVADGYTLTCYKDKAPVEEDKFDLNLN